MNKLKELFKKYQDVILYVIFGGLTTVVSIVVYSLCMQGMGMGVIPANVISWVAAVTVAYLTNRVWVFHSEAKGAKELLKEIFSFFMSRVVTLVIETAMLWVLVDVMHLSLAISIFGFSLDIIKVITTVVVIVLNYILSKLVVFRNKK